MREDIPNAIRNKAVEDFLSFIENKEGEVIYIVGNWSDFALSILSAADIYKTLQCTGFHKYTINGVSSIYLYPEQYEKQKHTIKNGSVFSLRGNNEK